MTDMYREFAEDAEGNFDISLNENERNCDVELNFYDDGSQTNDLSDSENIPIQRILHNEELNGMHLRDEMRSSSIGYDNQKGYVEGVDDDEGAYYAGTTEEVYDTENEDREMVGDQFDNAYGSQQCECSDIKIEEKDAAFILGKAGRTKRKICRVSGCSVALKDDLTLTLSGTFDSCKRARLYVSLIIQQRKGPVIIDFEPSDRGDCTQVEVPCSCVAFVTGAQGYVLRTIENEWQTLMFFVKHASDAEDRDTKRLLIFGSPHCRKGAELKVMSAIEQKIPGYYTTGFKPAITDNPDFDTDSMQIRNEDFSYALGRDGCTRKKLARAADCIIEYVGKVAFFAGTLDQRTRGRDYFIWLVEQRTRLVHANIEGRNDVSVVDIPVAIYRNVTGPRGCELRKLEEESNTFCFVDRNSADSYSKRLLIFGARSRDRQCASNSIRYHIHKLMTSHSHHISSSHHNSGSSYEKRSYSRQMHRHSPSYQTMYRGSQRQSIRRQPSSIPVSMSSHAYNHSRAIREYTSRRSASRRSDRNSNYAARHDPRDMHISSRSSVESPPYGHMHDSRNGPWLESSHSRRRSADRWYEVSMPESGGHRASVKVGRNDMYTSRRAPSSPRVYHDVDRHRYTEWVHYRSRSPVEHRVNYRYHEFS